MQQLFGRLNTLVMGKHPYNTIFSSNYHNISHIVQFLKASKTTLPQRKLAFADVGGGAAPYFDIFKDLIDQYTVFDVENVLRQGDTRNIKFIKSFAESLPAQDNSFDVVLSNQVLEHVISAEKTIAESYRVLKPGGWIIGSVPHISPLHLEPYDFRRFTEYGLRKVLEDNGFKKVKIDPNGGVFRSAAILILIDMTLTKRKEGAGQRFLTKKHFLMFPLTGFINSFAALFDFIWGDKNRSPSNYCWIAEKPN